MSDDHYHLTRKEIRKAARAAVKAFEDGGYDCCLFGSAACSIYGMQNRDPNDVDIIVLTDEADTEELKDVLVARDTRFFTVPAANPENTYRVLWFALPLRRACKVDVLVPGLLSIPNIPVRRIAYVAPYADIPLAPFLALLLLKLRGWTDHRADGRRRMRDKVPQDEDDIDELLEMAAEDGAGAGAGGEVHLSKERWLPRWFVREARERVSEYVSEWPGSAESWRALGFHGI